MIHPPIIHPQRRKAMSRNALAALGAAVPVLLALPAIGEARSEHHSSTAKNPASALNGIYRVRYTEKELAASGASAEYAKGNYGVSTFRLANGKYRYTNSRAPWACAGSYSISGRRVTFDFNVPHCHGILKAAWTLKGDSLRFRNIIGTDTGDTAFFGSKAWKKIG